MRYVITGGPGVGKTTTLERLAARGHTTVPESARDVIAAQQKAGADGILPWTDLLGFQYLVLDLQLRREREARGNPIFLDRGVIDAIAYCRTGNIPLPHALDQASTAKRYRRVFLLSPLANYKTDGQRKEDLALARQLHHAIGDAYVSRGCDVVEVPVLPPDERADYIIGKLF